MVVVAAVAVGGCMDQLMLSVTIGTVPWAPGVPVQLHCNGTKCHPLLTGGRAAASYQK